METFFDTLILSRLQFALKTLFHIPWASLGIGLSFYIFLMEALHLWKGEPFYDHQSRFWTRIFLLTFIVGVVSGIPLGFEFGTNWSRLSTREGGFIGEMLGVEATMAFMLEAGFLGIMIFGRDRVSKGLHLFATAMVALGTSLSAFWIMAANSWMQTPAGVEFVGGRYMVASYIDAIFNPDTPWGFSHMYVAALETTVFVIGGVSAWQILKNRHWDFFLRTFKMALVAALVLAPLQVLVGDISGKVMARHQPAKLAALEAHWETNPPGTGAAWKVVAWPDEKRQKNVWDIEIPYALSLITTNSLTGEVKGLREFLREDQPPVLVNFYSFRVMMAAGFGFVFLVVWGLWVWFKGWLRQGHTARERFLFYAWIAAVPAAMAAIETGWIAREVGRQPWVIYGIMRTKDAATEMAAGTVLFSLIGYLAIYTVLLGAFFFFLRRIMTRGPDLEVKATSGREE